MSKPGYPLWPHRLNDTTVEHMRQEGVIVLSPHFDDACFSIGALLSRIGRGVLINVFNRSLYLPRPPGNTTEPLSEEIVAQVRGTEDEAFARRCGLERIQLDFAEPGFHGRRNDDCSQVELDVMRAEQSVMAELRTLQARTGRKPYLLAPMAVGTHVNHQALHRIVQRNAAELMHKFRLGFYEDLPYARNPKARSRAVKRFRTEWGEHGIIRYVLTLDWQEKRKLVQIYASQFRRQPGVLKFRPAAWWPMGVHEAVWIC